MESVFNNPQLYKLNNVLTPTEETDTIFKIKVTNPDAVGEPTYYYSLVYVSISC